MIGRIMMVPLKDNGPVAAANVVRNLRREVFVVHEQKLNIAYIADKELLEAVREKMAGLDGRTTCSVNGAKRAILVIYLLVAAITNLIPSS
jgi:hypothetical protein